jgi:hypothetical protein
MGISTHILDTALGRPAAGVPVSLSRITEPGIRSMKPPPTLMVVANIFCLKQRPSNRESTGLTLKLPLTTTNIN